MQKIGVKFARIKEYFDDIDTMDMQTMSEFRMIDDAASYDKPLMRLFVNNYLIPFMWEHKTWKGPHKCCIHDNSDDDDDDDNDDDDNDDDDDDNDDDDDDDNDDDNDNE